MTRVSLWELCQKDFHSEAECGVIFAWELGLKKIILEGDSKVVMHSVADSHPAPLSIRYVVAAGWDKVLAVFVYFLESSFH